MSKEEPHHLTKEDREVLLAYKDAEVVKVVRKLMKNIREHRMVHRIITAGPHEIMVAQGEVRGVSACLNLLDAEINRAVEESKQKSAVKKTIKPIVPKI